MAWQGGFPLTSSSLSLTSTVGSHSQGAELHSTPQYSDLPSVSHLKDKSELERNTSEGWGYRFFFKIIFNLIFLTYSLYILLTVPLLVTPQSFPQSFPPSPSPSPLGRCSPLPKLQVSARLGTSSPTEVRQSSSAKRTYPTYRQQLLG